ncbi:MAG: AAA-like domain-containing protein [Verrucomicrobia bacterium]|nr:AAA-like domain-containing protein [Verrucomicrobiota bacterium]
MAELSTAPFMVNVQPRLEAEGGAVPLESPFYIVRSADEEFHKAIARRESTVLVKGSRQMGKTSLLARGLQGACKAGATVILTDVQKLNASDLNTVEAFLFTLADLMAEQLDLTILPRDVWKKGERPVTNFERYLKREVLKGVPNQLVWGLDELDRLFSVDYGADVFGLFRAWHNERVLDPCSSLARLTLAISYATEASLFIGDLNHSPFNVGTRLTLQDFTPEQVAELNRRYGSPLREGEDLERFYRLVGGHPFLVRRSLHEMVLRSLSYDVFEGEAESEDGIFGDHLRRIPLLLAEDPLFRDLVRGMFHEQVCPTLDSFERLRSAGLVVGLSIGDVRPRCKLYADYLRRHLK